MHTHQKNSHSMGPVLDTEFDQCLRELDLLGVMPTRVPTLSPTEEGLKRLGFYSSELLECIRKHPDRCIVVAGTNGKGSVCSTLEHLLSALGFSVGMYTSPHLIQITERIRFQGKEISREEFCSVYGTVKEKMRGLELSHFETLTLMAVEYYMATLPSYLIFEVGMGGVWDATNAIPHGTAVITRLGFDHEKYLGNSMKQIASNKLGIIKSYEGICQTSQVVHLPWSDEVDSLKNQYPWTHWYPAKLLNSRIVSENLPVWQIEVEDQYYDLALKGQRAVENTSLALAVMTRLGFSEHELAKHLAGVNWPGRMERLLYKGKEIYLSGDHNPQGIESLLEILKHMDFSELRVLFGAGKDKDIDSMLPQILGVKKVRLHLTVSPFKGRTKSEYGKHVNHCESFSEDPIVAFERMLRDVPNRALNLVTGSLYLVGLIRKHILEN